jgi:hypothetical protein
MIPAGFVFGATMIVSATDTSSNLCLSIHALLMLDLNRSDSRQSRGTIPMAVG